VEKLQQIFKATSIFSVKAVMAGNEVLMAGDPNAEADRGTWSDGDLCSGTKHLRVVSLHASMAEPVFAILCAP
jgi:hypothetical protein